MHSHSLLQCTKMRVCRQNTHKCPLNWLQTFMSLHIIVCIDCLIGKSILHITRNQRVPGHNISSRQAIKHPLGSINL
uniref:Uncharacterized protein n=1 Tax=Arundo donax TaxID=35708 RepID=A0A0A9A473_ARUDO